jgi:branched-chain amino acid transport system substrate-binding protein
MTAWKHGAAAIGLAWGAALAAGAAEPAIRVGALYNLTGGQSSLDQPSWQGAQLAAREVNAAGGVLGRPLELVLADGRTDPAAVEAAALKLVGQERVAVLVGLSDSTFALRAGPIAQKAGVAFVTSGATLPSLPETVGDGMFLACFGDNVQAQAAARFAAEERGWATAWILTDEAADFTRALSGFFRAAYVRLAGPDAIRGEATYRTGAADVSGAVAALKALTPAPAVLFVSALPEDAGRLVKQIREAGLETPILSGDGFDTPRLAEMAGPAARQVYFATHVALDNPDPRVQAFVKAYEAAWGGKPAEAFAALGYDTVRLVAAAIEKAGSAEPAANRQAMAGLDGFAGVTGAIRYADGRRVPHKSVTIMRLSEGKPCFERIVPPPP